MVGGWVLHCGFLLGWRYEFETELWDLMVVVLVKVCVFSLWTCC